MLVFTRVVPSPGRSPDMGCACSTHLTPVSTDEVTAGGPVLAGIGRALVQLLFAVAPSVTQGTLAVMGVTSIDADAGVLAQAINGQPWKTQRRKERHKRAHDTSGSDQLMSKVISVS